MKIKLTPPDFWSHEKPPAWAHPLGWLYGLASRWRNARIRPITVEVPVICVGNLSLGGTGKTPVVLSLASILKASGRRPHILTRGYGGRLGARTPVLVDPRHHVAQDVGDEALLLAAQAPTWVCRNRVAAAQAAIQFDADILLMDDGFQNPSLHKTISFLVVDGTAGFGNGGVFPAGPLREPVTQGLARTDAVILMGPATHPSLNTLSALGDKPFLHAMLKPTHESLAPLEGHNVLAFAGIGRPEKFFAMCRELSLHVLETVAFPDHHPYTLADLNKLFRRAQTYPARLITTAKDAARIPPLWQKNIRVIDVDVSWSEPDLLHHILMLT